MTEVLNTATAQIVYQLAALIISTVTTIVGFYVKSWLKANKYVKEYNLYNEKVERTLDNAVMYAEVAIKKYSKDQISKRYLALKYLDNIDPEMVAKKGAKLELMLDRKVAQRFHE
jgi:hypothetical protein